MLVVLGGLFVPGAAVPLGGSDAETTAPMADLAGNWVGSTTLAGDGECRCTSAVAYQPAAVGGDAE